MHSLVNIVIADEGWILERSAQELKNRLDYVSISKQPDPDSPINYYINYCAFKEKQPGIDISFFTDIEPRNEILFFDVAQRSDVCVCMSARYADELCKAGIQNIHVISQGVDFELFQPKIKIGVIGRTYPSGRKGDDLIQKVMDEPGIEWHFSGTGWSDQAKMLPADQVPEFYNSVDYVLISSYYEGGPMSILEALACGREVIAPPIGFVPDFPHIEYKTGDVEDLRRVLRELVAIRMARRETVLNLSWDIWARKHDALFKTLLQDKKGLQIKHISNKPLKVLLAMPSLEKQTPGGPLIRIAQTKVHLEKLGLKVEISDDEKSNIKDNDLVHVYNIWPPETALNKLRYLHSQGLPIVFSPIYLHLSEFAWASQAVRMIFKPGQKAEDIDQSILALRDNFDINGISRYKNNEYIPGYFAQIREMTGLADHLIGLSHFEIQRLQDIGIESGNFTLIRNAVDYSYFTDIDHSLFTQKYGIQDYVLCVGRIEPRKNQLMLIHALNKTGIPLVLLGQEDSNTKYSKLVHSFAGANVLFTGRISHEDPLLASAYAGAKVFCLPSWAEGAPLSALEAATVDVPLVLSNRSGEYEYFGEAAKYCDPFDPEEIRNNILDIYQTEDWNRENRQQLNLKLHEEFTWEKAVQGTLEAYFKAMESFETRLVSQTIFDQNSINQDSKNHGTNESAVSFHYGKGIYTEPAWNWVSEEGYIQVDSRSSAVNVDFELMCAPKQYYPIFPVYTDILVDGISIGQVEFNQPNPIKRVSITLPSFEKTSQICLKCNTSFNPLTLGINQDDRDLSVSLRNFTVTPLESTISLEPIITPRLIAVQEKAPDPELDGFYQNENGWKWLSKEGYISIPKNLLPAKIIFKLICNQAEFYSQFPLIVSISSGDKSITKLVFETSGEEKLVSLYLPKEKEDANISLKANATYTPFEHDLGEDYRELSVRMGHFMVLPYPIIEQNELDIHLQLGDRDYYDLQNIVNCQNEELINLKEMDNSLQIAHEKAIVELEQARISLESQGNKIESLLSELEQARILMEGQHNKIESLFNELEAKQISLQSTQAELAGVYHSLSYRITAPIRVFKKIIYDIKNSISKKIL